MPKKQLPSSVGMHASPRATKLFPDLPPELRCMLFDKMLEDRTVHLGEEKNQEGTYNSDIFESLTRTYESLRYEIESWFQRNKQLRRGPPQCGIFDPCPTLFLVDLSFLETNGYLGSLVMGGQPILRSCTDISWLELNSAWRDRALRENIKHLRVDIGLLSTSTSHDPACLLYSLLWNHFQKLPNLKSLDIILDVSQTSYKFDWRSIILADIWVWLGLCKWQSRCQCDQPCKYPATRYQDTSREKKLDAWITLELESPHDIVTFNFKYNARKRHRNRSLSDKIELRRVQDEVHEHWRNSKA